MKKMLPAMMIVCAMFACRKPKNENHTLPPPIMYRMIDSNFYIKHRLDQPPYYDGRTEETIFPLLKDRAFTVDTMSSVKQLIYLGVSLSRQGNSNTFSKESPSPLQGESVIITLDGDSVRITCIYNTQQNNTQYYYVRGVRK
ncbi:MAG TPA: hypothetical protein VL092_10015 [Chitinophagaceae bacterium]|nr:hypothetical protein [Chitinophagaceae bacterium]